MYGKQFISLEEITVTLLALNQWKQNASEESQGEGLVVRENLECGRRQGRKGTAMGKFRSKSRPRKAVQYYKCKDYGHMKKYYQRLRGQNDDKKNGDSSKSANVVQNDDLDFGD